MSFTLKNIYFSIISSISNFLYWRPLIIFHLFDDKIIFNSATDIYFRVI